MPKKKNNKARKDGKPKRNLVRWDQDLDIQLLLSIQAACNANSVKIPWDKVASTMGPKFTDGSIIQHLSKMRARREAEGKPVPPPLRRSVAPPSTRSGSKKKKRRHDSDDDDDSNDSDEEDKSSSEEDSPQTSQEDPGQRRQAKKRKTSKRQHTKQAIKKEKSESSSSEPDDDRLCVGFPFLKLRGEEEQGPDVDRPSDDEPGPSAKDSKTKKKKMVTFNLPPPMLRNLEETGSVYPSPSPGPSAEQTSLSHMVPSGMVFPAAQNMQSGQIYPAAPDWNALDNDIFLGFPGVYPTQYGQQYGLQYGQQQSGGEMPGQAGFIDPSLLMQNLADFEDNWTADPMMPPPMPPLHYQHRPRGGQSHEQNA